MPETPEQLAAALEELIQPGYRERLLAKGLARGIIWRNGVLPPESPHFPNELTTDLLDHGFHVLALALRLRDLERSHPVAIRGLYSAAEAIESASRHSSSDNTARGFHLTMAAAAFHIGGYSARAFSLFQGSLATLNLSSYEQSLVQLMRRNLPELRRISSTWLQDAANSDEGVLRQLEQQDSFGLDDVIAASLTRLYHRTIATFEVALLTGRSQYFERAIEMLDVGVREAAEARHIPLWWCFRVSRHLFDDLWGNSLHVVLPSEGGPQEWPTLRSRFIQFLASCKIAQVDLWPSQVEAASRVVNADDDLVVALPTSAGKTRIAELCILRCLADGKRVIYVTPLRALSAQIEHGLAATFRPLGFSVTSVYGASGVADSDLKTLVSANIVVATPEKVDFAIRQQPTVIDDVGLIVLDEGHMIGLSEREIRYEMLVQRLLRRADAAQRRLVCLSAVFSEGDAFNDFTAWLRSDVGGAAIRSTWRPTRQRPGLLIRNGAFGRLEFDVESERPFVPKFIEPQLPIGSRRTSFPNDDQEFLVASTLAFIRRGQTVLIYCPIKSSVEATGKAFLKAHRQGYFDSVLSAGHTEDVAAAIRLGQEWLGVEHPAVKCLSLGIAIHHGSLPRQFLGEIENLLRRRILPVCVCSPTLAQGLDLSFSVLVFRSLHRVRDLIPPKEFANVVGRVGRAFVDLDGLYVLPVFDTDRRRITQRTNDFRRLITQAQRRQLESGVRELVRYIILVLSQRLNIAGTVLAEYVLNQSSTWEVPAQEGDTWHEWLRSALNELDTAILGIVDTLDLPTEGLSDYLDQCLQSSYWQRRLLRGTPEDKALQEQVIRGRAQWIWNRSTAEKRRSFFAAGIGHAAGSAIDAQSTEIAALLEAAESAAGSGDLGNASTEVIQLAEILFAIGPFQKESSAENWKDILTEWIRGTALGSCADNEGIAFIQEDVVYRLVWAVEAARLSLQHTNAIEEPPGATVALCLTYGVPSKTAAIFMQGGIRSRTLATKLAAQIEYVFADVSTLRFWLLMLHQGAATAPVLETDDERAEWEHFLGWFEHQHIAQWRQIETVIPIQWYGEPLNSNVRVRVSRSEPGTTAVVSTVTFQPAGEVELPSSIESNFFFGVVSEDQESIAVSFYGR